MPLTSRMAVWPGGVERGDRHGAVVLDVDLGAGLLRDPRIILPPGPISRRIFSGDRQLWQARGVPLIASRAPFRPVTILRRIWMRPSFACSSATLMTSSVTT